MELPPPITESKPPETQPTTTSLLARLLNVFAIPGDVFDEVKRSAFSTANWLVPAVLLIVIGCAGSSLVLSQPAIQQQLREANDKVIDKMVEKGRIPKEQADRQREAGAVGGQVGSYIGVVLSAIVTPFWWGLLIWLVGTKVFHGQFPFMKAVEVAGLGNTIGILESVVTTLLCVSLGSINGAPSAALLVKDYDPQNTSHALLSVANVMTIWVLVVWAIGLTRLSGSRFVPAFAWVFGLWALKTSFLVGLGLAVKAFIGL